MTLKVFSKYRAAFREFKSKLPTYFKSENKKPKTWDFQEWDSTLFNSILIVNFCNIVNI